MIQLKDSQTPERKNSFLPHPFVLSELHGWDEAQLPVEDALPSLYSIY